MDTRMTRKDFLKTGVFGAASILLTRVGADALTVMAQGRQLDLLIKNGRIADGTGRPAFAGAIGIRDGRIADIGDIPDSSATSVIDASGQYVCPGFIDPHTHEEILMLADPVLEKFVRQGVTTIVNGNCGHSVTPYRAKTVLEYWWREALISRRRRDMNVDWEGVDGYAKAVQHVGATINSAVLLGYGGIRWGAMKSGVDRPPSAAEWKEIERLVASGCEQGAVGMSTGLSYRPCYYATTDECVRVAKILAKYDKTYSSHTRPGNRSASAEGSAGGGLTGGEEAVYIGEHAGCRVQISHYQRTQAAFDLVDGAMKRGLEVAVDIIPQSVSHRRASDRMLEALMVFYPGVFDYSVPQLKELLHSDKTKADILKTVSFFNNNKEQVVVVRALTPKNEANVGKSVAEIAKTRGKDPNDLYVEMVLDERNPVIFTFDGNARDGGRGRGIASGQGRAGQENPLPPEFWTKHRRFGPGSDTIPVDVDEPYGWFEDQRRGAFPGYFKQAKTAGVVIEEAVRKATLLPATQFRLKDRGTLEKGKVADVIVFDPERYSYPTPAEGDVNTPFTVASGVAHVVVNGTPVLVDAKLTGKKPGKVLI
jgi:N-acyl-D-amino-acid deacylase